MEISSFQEILEKSKILRLERALLLVKDQVMVDDILLEISDYQSNYSDLYIFIYCLLYVLDQTNLNSITFSSSSDFKNNELNLLENEYKCIIKNSEKNWEIIFDKANS